MMNEDTLSGDRPRCPKCAHPIYPGPEVITLGIQCEECGWGDYIPCYVNPKGLTLALFQLLGESSKVPWSQRPYQSSGLCQIYVLEQVFRRVPAEGGGAHEVYHQTGQRVAVVSEVRSHGDECTVKDAGVWMRDAFANLPAEAVDSDKTSLKWAPHPLFMVNAKPDWHSLGMSDRYSRPEYQRAWVWYEATRW